jgi:hypothetical protein
VAQNMMNSNHKATNENYRNEYDRIFRKKKKGIDNVKVKQRKNKK